MKFKIAAGAELDLLTKDEMSSTLTQTMVAWRRENAQGDRYVKFSAQGLIDTAAVEFGGPTETYTLGPGEGFVWDVRRVCVTGYDSAGGDIIGIYVNAETPLSLVATTTQSATGLFLFDRQCVLYGGDRLLFAGSSLAATGYVKVTGTARELPISMAWRL